MGTQVTSAGDLFQDGEVKAATDTDLYESKSALQAGAAQKSSRPRKSATAFRTISEVADDLGVQQHVLRFWETKFSQVKPLKRGGGRRYYRPEDIDLLQSIYCLLYVEGYTIKGVQKLLREVGKKKIIANFSNTALENNEVLHRDDSIISDTSGGEAVKNSSDKDKTDKLSSKQRDALESVLAELRELRGMVKKRS